MNTTKRTLACLLSAAMLLTNTAFPVTAADVVPGDVNGDGCVNALDAALILKEVDEIAAGGSGTFTEEQRKAADAEKNGKLESRDGERILDAAVTNALDPKSYISYFDKVDSIFTTRMEQGRIEFRTPKLTEDDLEKWNYQVPVLVQVDTGAPVNSIEFGLNADAPFKLIRNKELQKYKNEPWYSVLTDEHDPVEFAEQYFYCHAENGKAWFSYATGKPEEISGVVGVILVDVPKDSPYQTGVHYLKKTETRTSFLTQVDGDQMIVAEPDVIEGYINPMSNDYAGLSITKMPTKRYYQIGEELDLTGGEASASGRKEGSYWDVFNQPLDSQWFTVDASEFDNTKPGVYVIIVRSTTDPNAMDTFEVAVEGTQGMTQPPTGDWEYSLKITRYPNKRYYQIGDLLNLKGCYVSAGVNGSGSDWNLEDMPYNCGLFEIDASEFDNTRPGQYSIYIRNGKAEGTVTVWVLDSPYAPTESISQPPEPTQPSNITELPDVPTDNTDPTETTEEEAYISFMIKSPPTKLTYQIGEELDLTGGIGNASGRIGELLWDTFDQPLSYFKVDASKFDNTKPGKYTIYVTATGGSASKTLSFDVTVVGNGTGTTEPTEETPRTGTSGKEEPQVTTTQTTTTGKKGSGDIDGNGKSDIMDIIRLNKFLLGVYQLTDSERAAADVNGDGVIDANDSIAAMRKMLDIPEQSQPVDTTEPTTVPPLETTTEPTNPFPQQDPELAGITPVKFSEHFYGANAYKRNYSGGEGTKIDVITNELNSLIGLFGHDFYENNNLITISLDEGSGSNHLRVTDVTADEDGNYTVLVERTTPKIATCDMVTWHLFVATDKGITDPKKVKVEFTNVMPTEPNDEPTEPVTEYVEDAIKPEKISEHFYGAKVYRGTASDGMVNKIQVNTDENNSLIGLYKHEFYENNNLIIATVTESSGSNRLEVKDVKVDADGVYTIMVTRTMPEISTCDLARWYLYVVTDKGITDAKKVKVEFTDVVEKMQ